MIFHENRLPADDSHGISCLVCYFEKAAKFEIDVCCIFLVPLSGLITILYISLQELKHQSYPLCCSSHIHLSISDHRQGRLYTRQYNSADVDSWTSFTVSSPAINVHYNIFQLKGLRSLSHHALQWTGRWSLHFVPVHVFFCHIPTL